MDLDPLILLVDLLAVYRLTRLVTKDSLLDTPRHWLLQRWPSELTTFPRDIVRDLETVEVDDEKILVGRLDTGVTVYLDDAGWKADRTFKWTELLECPWCAGMYLSAMVVALQVWWPFWIYVAVTLAFSALVGLIFSHLDND